MTLQATGVQRSLVVFVHGILTEALEIFHSVEKRPNMSVKSQEQRPQVCPLQLLDFSTESATLPKSRVTVILKLVLTVLLTVYSPCDMVENIVYMRNKELIVS